MKGILKWPLIIAAIVVVARVVSEQAGAPNWFNNLLSVVVLYLIIFPLYSAARIATSGISRPYRNFFKSIAIYEVLARSMVIVTYWLAYYFQWTAPRFGTAQGGNVGEGVPSLAGYVLIPFGALLAWLVSTLLIG